MHNKVLKDTNGLSFLSSVSAEQQLQPFLCHLLPSPGEGEGASHSAAEPPVWHLEPEAQEHV